MAVGRACAVLVFAAACSASHPVAPQPAPPPTTPPAAPTTAALPPPSAEALAAERGHGVPRDYARAGELYAQLCRQGEGDLRACNKLLEVADRLDVDHRQYATRVRMCQRGDKAACIITLPGGKADLDTLAAEGIDLDKLPQQCTAGDLSACQFLLVMGGFGAMLSSHHDTTPTTVAVASVMLHADPDLVFDATAEACASLLEGSCNPRGRTEPTDWGACLHDLAAPTEGLTPADQQEVAAGTACLSALTRACDQGSVPACEPLDGRQVSSCVRCTAGDKRACTFSDVGECAAASPARAP